MMELGHGLRLSAQEYQRRIVQLYDEQSAAYCASPLERSRKELDLTIDFRLGQDFPRERRERLWAIQERLAKYRWRFVWYWLLGLLSFRLLEKRTNALAGFLVKEYATHLSPAELKAFFGEGECNNPTLPVDRTPGSPLERR